MNQATGQGFFIPLYGLGTASLQKQCELLDEMTTPAVLTVLSGLVYLQRSSTVLFVHDSLKTVKSEYTREAYTIMLKHTYYQFANT